MTGYRIAQGASMWVAPVGSTVTDPRWRHVGYADEGAVTYVIDDDEPVDPAAFILPPGPRTMSLEVKLTRRQMVRLWAMLAPKTRNRRRNPLHAVRDRLRRHRRERARGR